MKQTKVCAAWLWLTFLPSYSVTMAVAETVFDTVLKANLSVEERLSVAADLKAKGNTAFESEREQLALKYWHHVRPLSV